MELYYQQALSTLRNPVEGVMTVESYMVTIIIQAVMLRDAQGVRGSSYHVAA